MRVRLSLLGLLATLLGVPALTSPALASPAQAATTTRAPGVVANRSDLVSGPW